MSLPTDFSATTDHEGLGVRRDRPWGNVERAGQIVEVNGVRWLSDRTIDLTFREQSNGIDLVLGAPTRFGIGFGLPTDDWPAIPGGQVCWWTGAGGSKAINVLDRKLTFAYVMNKMSTGFLGDERSTDLFAAVIDAGGAQVR